MVQSAVSSETTTCFGEGFNPSSHSSSQLSDVLASCGSCHHTRYNAAYNWCSFCKAGSTVCTRWPSMFQTCCIGLKIRAHGWPWKRSHGFTFKVGDYSRWTMRFGVVIDTNRSCSWWLVVEMGTTPGCTDHLLGFLVWWTSTTCNHEIYTLILLVSL